jgi:uncharacterized protein (TIGR02246 family)
MGDDVMKRSMLLVALPLLALAACNQATMTAGSETELAAIRQIEQAQQAAYNSHDLDGAVAAYADDAVFVGPGETPTRGIDAIRAGAESMMSDPNMNLAITSDKGWVAASGDLAVTTANWTLTLSGADGSPVSTSGVNQSAWRKQANGKWKMVTDFNSATPAIAELPE